MKTTIFTLFFLSSVCFFPQFGNLKFFHSDYDTCVQLQDTTKIEYWKQEVKKWKAEAELQRRAAEINAQEAIEQRNLAEKKAVEAEQQHIKAEDWKFLYYNLEKGYVEMDSVFRDFAKQTYEDGIHLDDKIAELEKVIEEQKKEIEELKKKIKN